MGLAQASCSGMSSFFLIFSFEGMFNNKRIPSRKWLCGIPLLISMDEEILVFIRRSSISLKTCLRCIIFLHRIHGRERNPYFYSCKFFSCIFIIIKRGSPKNPPLFSSLEGIHCLVKPALKGGDNFQDKNNWKATLESTRAHFSIHATSSSPR